ncbi:MAG TPA: IS630 family transposase [Gemmatimonadaceae bacterium]|nr:IS630 family transposase [Gemmatimonadaceae bacterium]
MRSWTPSALARRPRFPPLQRAQIERIACTHPAAYGRHLTRWDCRSLSEVAVEEAVVGSIHYTTVARVLSAASLQPHRSRYWKTATIDDSFTRQAARVLWCYERVEWLERRGELVVCLDEKPNLQALERLHPAQLPGPGRITRHEFEYTRHGTVTFLAALHVFDGAMWGTSLDANDGAHFLGALRHCLARRAYRAAKRIHLILDNGPSHIAQATRTALATLPRVRAIYTPPHASWLDQAELLLRAFSDRYLVHLDVPPRPALIDHLDGSWREYNRHYAYPFTWSWTRRDMRTWAHMKDLVIRSKTSATVH